MNRVLGETIETGLVFDDINSFSQYVYALSCTNYKKISTEFAYNRIMGIDQQYLKMIYRQNKHLLEQLLRPEALRIGFEVDKIANILHCFNRLQIDLNEMDSVLHSKES